MFSSPAVMWMSLFPSIPSIRTSPARMRRYRSVRAGISITIRACLVGPSVRIVVIKPDVSTCTLIFFISSSFFLFAGSLGSQ